MAELHDPTEHYLACVYRLQEEGITPIRARLVERLQLSAPSVSEHVARLCDQGLLELEADRTIALTTKGRKVAERTIRRHRLAELMLLEILGLEWAETCEEADRLEHAISEKIEGRLVEILNDPKFCPHGRAIPGTGAKYPEDLVSLADASPNQRYEIFAIGRALENDSRALAALSLAGALPGKRIVIERDERGVRLGGQTVTADVAAQISVRVAD